MAKIFVFDKICLIFFVVTSLLILSEDEQPQKLAFMNDGCLFLHPSMISPY